MQKTENTEVLIVGQGLAGTLLSYHLMKKNISHKVIDIQKPGSASRVAAGLINPIVVKRVTKTWQADVFYPYAHQLYQELETFLDCRFYYPLVINKLYGKEDEHFWQHRNEKEQLDDYITTDANYDLPNGIKQPYGYGTIKRSARLDISTMLDAYRQLLKKEKLLIEDELKDDELELLTDGIRWKGISADRIIFCRGSFDAQCRLFQHLKWNNTKGELLDVEVKGLELNSIVSKGVFVMPVGKNAFKIGATYAHHWQDLNATEEKLQELREKWELISNLPFTINQQLRGIRPTLADRRPVLTFLKEQASVGIFNGLGSRGGLMAPYLAKQMLNKL
ncbi:NAD(P)/FAD-dependent oxidoreductase [Carboxylicivirga sp. RSCT41]|uniref:NAD(P)/FAD-dependent oxidoreductase n=1 Tax=Carboxylicivirga agarovorans TaxID=3417570 RepID=UPI003D332D10